MTDWLLLKTDYINGNISMRDLAKKHDVSYSQIAKVAAAQKWNAQRESHRIMIAEKTQQKSVELMSDAYAGVMNSISKAAERVVLLAEKAMGQVETEDGMIRVDDLAKIAKILKDAKDVQTGLVPAVNTESEVRVIIDV